MANYKGYEKWNQSKQRGNSMLAGTVSVRKKENKQGVPNVSLPRVFLCRYLNFKAITEVKMVWRVKRKMKWETSLIIWCFFFLERFEVQERDERRKRELNNDRVRTWYDISHVLFLVFAYVTWEFEVKIEKLDCQDHVR